MNPIDVIDTYYERGSKAHGILVDHSRRVAARAVAIAQNVPYLSPDLKFIHEASMLHDIGILKTNSPELGCFGKYPYVCHGYLGREMLEAENLPKHALVCERHVGTGITLGEIKTRRLPLPLREMITVSVEEQIVCYADKFFSKNGGHSHPPQTVEMVCRRLAPYGGDSVKKFLDWAAIFGTA